MFPDVLLEDIDYCLKTRVLWLSALFLSSIAIIEYLYDTSSSAGCLERRSRVMGDPGFRETFCKNCFQFPSGNNRRNPGDIVVGHLNILEGCL